MNRVYVAASSTLRVKMCRKYLKCGVAVVWMRHSEFWSVVRRLKSFNSEILGKDEDD